ncbi:MAG: cation diffusion facilitator family transporter [Dethiobacteria bacterium]|jgi:cation diffusion facilitator family transporter
MRSLEQVLIKAVAGDRDISCPQERLRLGYIGGWVSIAGNAVLASLKFVVGLASGSVSLLANAVHTASDILTSVVVLIGFKISSKGPDREHPYGHGRVEYLIGLTVAVALIAVGIGFIYDAYRRLASGITMQPSLAAIIVALGSILAKELMYRFAGGLSKLIDSEALMADAWHHRSDAFTSALVLVAVCGGYFRISWLDPVSAFLVAGFIIYTGAEIAYQAANKLIGVSPSPDLLGDLEKEALAVEGVLNVHDLEVHDYGIYKAVTLHIRVDGQSMSLSRAHQIAHLVQERLEENFNCKAIVHPDPLND